LQVKNVVMLGEDSEGMQLHLWQLANVIKKAKPMCLFKENQQLSAGYDAEGNNHYTIYDRKARKILIFCFGFTSLALMFTVERQDGGDDRRRPEHVTNRNISGAVRQIEWQQGPTA
jgi:hypothetical protein